MIFNIFYCIKNSINCYIRKKTVVVNGEFIVRLQLKAVPYKIKKKWNWIQKNDYREKLHYNNSNLSVTGSSPFFPRKQKISYRRKGKW